MILSLSNHIEARAKDRPDGYVDEVMSMASRVDGDEVEIPDKAYAALLDKYRGGPTIPELVENFAGAMMRWAGAGFPTVSRETFDDRLVACTSCEHWTGSKCIKCGCYRLKMWLSTEHCPIGNWPEIQP